MTKRMRVLMGLMTVLALVVAACGSTATDAVDEGTEAAEEASE